MNSDFLSDEFLGNSIEEYIIAIGILVGLVIVFAAFQKLILHRLDKLAKKTKTNIDDAVIAIFKNINPPFYIFVAFYIALKTLSLNGLVNKIISALILIWITILVVKAAQIFIDVLFKSKMDEEHERGTKTAITAVKMIVKIVLWGFGLLLVLSNLGVNITSLIAGLGVGGIAIALALQNILSDLFSSFAIYFDKPFIEGDFIVVGQHAGTVEKIGIKTTRIRALQGEEIVISNQELTSARIQNFKNMKQRRITFMFGVLYETPTEKMKQIPEMVKKVVDRADNAKFDRANFKEFADSSLNYEVVYYVTSSDYKDYMNTHEKINLGIKQIFEEAGIEMAYPTQTLYLKK